MDKVIIDGVDVSGCEHYRAEIETKMPYGEYEIQKDKCHYSGIEIIQDCKGIKGCIYKQLKRLQAENEILKEKLQISQNSDKKTIEIIKENERLKELKCEFKEYCTCNTEKYVQCLQEIRDIVSKIIDSYIRPYGDFDQLKTILDKINEVLGVE